MLLFTFGLQRAGQMAGLLGIGMNVAAVELGSLPVLTCLFGSARPVAGGKPGHNTKPGVVLGRRGLHLGRRAGWLFYGSPAGWQDPKAPKKKSPANPEFSVAHRYMVIGSEKRPHVVIAKRVCHQRVL